MSASHCIIGTRGSKLALVQTRAVAALLRQHHPRVCFAEERITTRGDRDQDRALPEIGGKGLFTAEIERALLEQRAHLAVHSLKDLPTAMPTGLCIAAFPARGDARDAWVCPAGHSLEDAPPGTRVGTSSLRRRAQVLARRPDLAVCAIRGNVDTRLRKLDEGQVDALVLAAAGLDRLGLGHRATSRLDLTAMVPAAGQGALAVQAVTDTEAAALAACLDDPDTRTAAAAERSLLAALGGGCHVPIAGHAQAEAQGPLTLTGLVASPDGAHVVRQTMTGPGHEPEGLGLRVAQYLLDHGARDILDSVPCPPAD